MTGAASFCRSAEWRARSSSLMKLSLSPISSPSPEAARRCRRRSAESRAGRIGQRAASADRSEGGAEEQFRGDCQHGRADPGVKHSPSKGAREEGSEQSRSVSKPEEPAEGRQDRSAGVSDPPGAEMARRQAPEEQNGVEIDMRVEEGEAQACRQRTHEASAVAIVTQTSPAAP